MNFIRPMRRFLRYAFPWPRGGTRRPVALSVALLVAAAPAGARAQAAAVNWYGLYDMRAAMAQPHPFAVAPAGGEAPAPVAPWRSVAQRSAPVSRMDRPSAAPARDAAPRGGGWKFSDVVSEVRAGLFAHDTGPFSSREEGGVDTNLEVLFRSPAFLSIVWSPRPHLGVSVNSSGDTSQAYLGLTWEYAFASRWFVEFSFGGMVHNGHLVGIDDDGVIVGKSLGCRFLFRESIGVGYRFGERLRHSAIVHFEHSSNADLCEKNTWDGTAGGRQDFVMNEGLESVGLRYGHRF